MKKILITGAGGFIGGRLVEILKETENPEICILLRNIAKAARISSYPLNYFKGSASNENAIAASMQGCDTVVHCAHNFASPEENLQAADIIAKQCLQNGVSKLVYISSFAVHSSNAEDRIKEDSLLNEQWEYAVNKIAIEKKLMEYHKQKGLPVIILRPAVVYGPFSAAWTTNTVMQMLGGRVVIPYEGERICNAVYIDDVVNAIIKALRSPASCNGKTFIVSGPGTVSWKDYYNSFLPYGGLSEPVLMSRQESELFLKNFNGDKTAESKASLLKDPVSFLKTTPVYNLYKALLKNPGIRKKLLSAKANIPRQLIYPSKDAFETLSCIGRADITKLKTELGYYPQFNFNEGMKKTLLWIEWANLNSN